MPSILERLQQRIHGAPSWPPPDVSVTVGGVVMPLPEWWERVQSYRRRYEARREDLLPYATDLNKTKSGRSIFTPVPLAREIGAYSAVMLFSAMPQITFDENEDLLDEVVGANALLARMHSAAARIAIEGRGALRVHLDESVSEVVQVHYVPEDMVIWDERHGDIVIGGGVVIEKQPDARRDVVYRLLEEHEVGTITRTLYKGSAAHLGRPVDLEELPEFSDLDESLETNLDAPTLYRWNNKPGGESDLAGLESLLDRYDEGWSLLVDKMRKSVPVSYADASLFNDSGQVDLSGVVPMRAGHPNLTAPMTDDQVVKLLAGTIQPDLQADAHIRVLDRMREEILTDAGYSLSSYGLEVSGTADSGTALRLKQQRTTQTKNSKEWEATEAIKNALSCAMCWQDGGRVVRDYRPEVKLADATPRDPREEAQVAVMWEGAEAISLEEMIRIRRPEWDDEMVDRELERIRSQKSASAPSVPQLDLQVPTSEAEENGRG